MTRVITVCQKLATTAKLCSNSVPRAFDSLLIYCYNLRRKDLVLLLFFDHFLQSILLSNLAVNDGSSFFQLYDSIVQVGLVEVGARVRTKVIHLWTKLNYLFVILITAFKLGFRAK